ncbi:hypothetical protein GBAR_LOCUS31052, partial [Geodia barretti]
SVVPGNVTEGLVVSVVPGNVTKGLVVSVVPANVTKVVVLSAAGHSTEDVALPKPGPELCPTPVPEPAPAVVCGGKVC